MTFHTTITPDRAVFSKDGRYRYLLTRLLLSGSYTILVIMVNPSTATASKNDPTITRVVNFGRKFKARELLIGNLFAFRSAYIKDLAGAEDPIGPLNDFYLRAMMKRSDFIVVAWGAKGKLPAKLRQRWKWVTQEAKRQGKALYCFKTLTDGQPQHPLMLPSDSRLRIWEPPV